MLNPTQGRVSISFAYVGTVVFLAVIVALCGCGGAGLGYDPATTGTVTGQVVDLNNELGVPGAQITVASRSDASDSLGGFEIAGVPPGSQQVVVDPPAPYVLVGTDPIAQVVAQQVTTLGKVYVLPEGDLPPPP
ncbi:MAG: hypothetical protein KAW89_11055 [Armatimonadetes bacterium]|nr:hypothetical protein [Armatimonadota bacterium]